MWQTAKQLKFLFFSFCISILIIDIFSGEIMTTIYQLPRFKKSEKEREFEKLILKAISELQEQNNATLENIAKLIIKENLDYKQYKSRLSSIHYRLKRLEKENKIYSRLEESERSPWGRRVWFLKR